jgi:hypothetical protein
MEAGFRIPGHVHVCVTADGSVLLDLKRDRYFGLDRAQTELLAELVPQWPRPAWEWAPDTAIRGGDDATAIELCESLAGDGLLDLRKQGEGEPSCDESDACRRSDTPRRDMKGEWTSIGDELEVRARMGTRDVIQFISAYAWARWSLAARSLATIEGAVRRSKQRALNPTKVFSARPRAVSASVNQVAAWVDTFRRLRPFVFAAEGRCLLHALTLVRFLEGYRFYPEWVIGVATQPWSAHSWVQWDCFLLDTNPEKVCGFTPILVV